MSAEVKRYSTAMIVLHWGLALAIVLAAGFGALVLDGMASDNAHKPGLLKMHLELGSLILLFTAVRLILRARTPRPAPLPSGNVAADKLAVGVQHLMYALTLFTALAGMMLAYSAGLFAILYQHVGSLPEDFDKYAAHEVHGWLAYVLLGAAALHVLGALKQHFVLKNGLLARMSLGKQD